MSRRTTIAFAVACLACCLPLLFAIAGVTTGAAGAVGYWFGRNQALIVVGIGLTYLVITATRHIRAKAAKR
jgi:hypothetical protein